MTVLASLRVTQPARRDAPGEKLGGNWYNGSGRQTS
jgi:hypothetical protein